MKGNELKTYFDYLTKSSILDKGNCHLYHKVKNRAAGRLCRDQDKHVFAISVAGGQCKGQLSMFSHNPTIPGAICFRQPNNSRKYTINPVPLHPCPQRSYKPTKPQPMPMHAFAELYEPTNPVMPRRGNPPACDYFSFKRVPVRNLGALPSPAAPGMGTAQA